MAFELFKGIEWRRRLTVTDVDTGTRTNLTGKTIQFQLRRRTGEPVLIEKQVASGITLLAQSGDTLGQADLVVLGADTTSLDAPTNHVVCVLVDGQVVLPPLKLSVRST